MDKETMNVFDQMTEALNTARDVQNEARNNAARMAQFLPGNMDKVDHGTLVKLKRELARYNMHTGRWSK
jgi:hypothetical protein